MILRAALAAALLAILALIPGCAAAPPARAVPALRMDAGAEALARLEAAAARLVGASRVDLAADAFLVEAELAVERRSLRTVEGPADGLDLSPPLRLRLELLGELCRLRLVGGEETIPLPGLACEAAADRSAQRPR